MEFLRIHVTKKIPTETLGGVSEAIDVATFEENLEGIWKEVLEEIPRWIVKDIQKGVPHLKQMLDEIVRKIS